VCHIADLEIRNDFAAFQREVTELEFLMRTVDPARLDLGVMPPLLMGAPESPDDTRHAVRFGFGAGVDKAFHGSFEARFGFPLIEPGP
jgi:hypothetical protein